MTYIEGGTIPIVIAARQSLIEQILNTLTDMTHLGERADIKLPLLHEAAEEISEMLLTDDAISIEWVKKNGSGE